MLRTKFLSLNFESTMHLPPSGGFAPAGAGPRPRGVELQTWSPMSAPGSASSASNPSLWSNAQRPLAELPRLGASEPQANSPPIPRESELSNFQSQISEPGAELTAADPPPADSPPPAAAASHGTGHGEVRAMQIRDTYIVVETDEGLTLIDQHALHERIMYEYLRPRVLDNAVESQRMLVPETVELTPKETALLVEYADVLNQLGLGVQEFGRQTVLVDRYPVMLKKANLPQLVRDLAEQLDQPDRPPDRRDLLDSLLHMMSCKAAIKAGQRLSPEEIDSLLAQRHLIADAHHCPHGRPTALVLTENELERQFGRLG
jgi:DNA mismatch repair protein MutL